MYVSLSVWSIIISLVTRRHNRRFMLCAVKLNVLGLKAYWYTGSAFHQIPSIIFHIQNNSRMECFAKWGSKRTNIGTVFSHVTSVINNISITLISYLNTKMSGNTEKGNILEAIHHISSSYLLQIETYFCQHIKSRFFGFNGQDQKTRIENNAPKQLIKELTTKWIWFSLDFQLFCTIMQLLDPYWPANILAGSHVRAQENGLMSPRATRQCLRY